METELLKFRAISSYVRSYYDIQKTRIEHGNRCAALVKQGDFASEKEAEQVMSLPMSQLEMAEKLLKKFIDVKTRQHPVRKQYLAEVKGIGEVLSGGLIAHIETRHQVSAEMEDGSSTWVTVPDNFPNEGTMKDRYEKLGIATRKVGRKKEWCLDWDHTRQGIACFETVTALWAFAGVALNGDGQIQRRRKGEQSNWSSTMKVLVWKIGESFVRCGGEYRKEYDRYKARQHEIHPEPETIQGPRGPRKIFTDGHLHNRSKRYVAKLFLSHLWSFWRELKGLPVRLPYAIEYLQHTKEKKWQDFLG
jgi:hypothetical protein